MSRWFCSSGFGPRPSSGTVRQRWNGLAGPSMSAKKNSATTSPATVATATSGSAAALAEPVRHEREVAAEDQRPQQDRALERGPQPGDREEQRRAGGVVLGDVAEREVVADQRPLHRARGGDRGEEHDEHAAAAEAQQERVVQLQPGEERGDADDRGAGAERDGRVSERGLHAI